MSNLIDKSKLLPALSGSGLQEIRERIVAGEFDFHPLPASPRRVVASQAVSTEEIKKVCMGAATGKGCIKLRDCRFIQGREAFPCPEVVANFTQRGVKILVPVGVQDSDTPGRFNALKPI